MLRYSVLPVYGTPCIKDQDKCFDMYSKKRFYDLFAGSPLWVSHLSLFLSSQILWDGSGEAQVTVSLLFFLHFRSLYFITLYLCVCVCVCVCVFSPNPGSCSFK